MTRDAIRLRLSKKDHVMPRTACLLCGHETNMACAVKEEGEAEPTPKPGDMTLCIRCGCVMIFDQDLNVRAPTAEEKAEIDQMPHIQFIKMQIDIAQQALAQRKERERER